MTLNRRSFLRAAVVLAPAVILTPGLLMRVRPLGCGIAPYVQHNGLWMPPEIAALLMETNALLRDMAWVDHEIERVPLLAPRLLLGK